MFWHTANKYCTCIKWSLLNVYIHFLSFELLKLFCFYNYRIKTIGAYLLNQEYYCGIPHNEVKKEKCISLIWFLTVADYFWSHVLAFSSNLDELNPGVSEWREDIGRVVKSCMVQVSSSAASWYYNDPNIIRNELNSRRPHSHSSN